MVLLDSNIFILDRFFREISSTRRTGPSSSRLVPLKPPFQPLRFWRSVALLPSGFLYVN